MNRSFVVRSFAAALLISTTVAGTARSQSRFADFVEPGFPFIVSTVDAGKLGTNFVESVLHLVFNPQQVAIEERPQASEAGDGRKAMKATEELGKLREQWARLTLNSKLIHDSSWVGSSVHHARRNQNRRIR